MDVSNNYVLLAKEITTDAADNMVSIIKIIEKFTFGIDPVQLRTMTGQIVVPVGFAIGTSWQFNKPLQKDTLIIAKFRFIDPDGKDLGGEEKEHSISKNFQKINVNFNHQGLPITSSGQYSLHVELLTVSGNEVVASANYPFEVELVDIKTSTNLKPI
jgi:hypothetical protein